MSCLFNNNQVNFFQESTRENKWRAEERNLGGECYLCRRETRIVKKERYDKQLV